MVNDFRSNAKLLQSNGQSQKDKLFEEIREALIEYDAKFKKTLEKQ